MKTLSRQIIKTPLGDMIALADEAALYLLEFKSRKNFERQLANLLKSEKAHIIDARTAIHDQIEAELSAYFNAALTRFKTPVKIGGTPFQASAYAALQAIPYGQTRSYAEQALSVKNARAVRAIASANASNRLAIIVPCHRVIGKNGALSGYAGGIERKQALLDLERRAA